MKRSFIIFILNLAAAYGFSQDAAHIENGYNKARVGVKGGIVLTNIKTQAEPGIKFSNLLRLRVGLFGHVPVSSKVYFRPEIMLAGKGAKYESTYATREIISYVEMPLNLLYKAASSKGIFLVGGGIAPAFLINRESYSAYTTSTDIKKFDLGLNATAVYEWPLGFSFNIYYTYGLLNMRSRESPRPPAKNRCFGLSLGYLF